NYDNYEEWFNGYIDHGLIKKGCNYSIGCVNRSDIYSIGSDSKVFVYKSTAKIDESSVINEVISISINDDINDAISVNPKYRVTYSIKDDKKDNK
ncbi:hypothetical protein B2H99_16695, partial [Morganella morganii]|uniref:hypothetical protein n=2 Tax=Morganella morganii TaxID=582 RepID=UPI0009F0A4F9